MDKKEKSLVFSSNSASTALTIMLVVFAVVLLFIIFRKNVNGDIDMLYKYQLAQKDTAIAVRDRTIDVLRAAKVRSDSAYFQIVTSIAVLQGEVQSIRNNKATIIHAYEKIPFDVANYSRDSLRKQFTNPD